MKKRERIPKLHNKYLVFTSILLTLGIIYFLTFYGGITGYVVVNYQPIDGGGNDSYIKSGAFQDISFGSDVEMLVGYTGAPLSQRGLMLFENLTTDIPSANTILNATLELYVTDVSSETNITV